MSFSFYCCVYALGFYSAKKTISAKAEIARHLIEGAEENIITCSVYVNARGKTQPF